MVVVYEFLGAEPIENVITCMNYEVDKAVFFGYEDRIQALKASTDKFLKEICGVTEVVYYALPKDDLQSVLNVMRKEIESELEQNNQIYFDITGGESLFLVAFGMLSSQYKTPIHQFDVVNNKIIELVEGADTSISHEVIKQKISLIFLY